MTGSFGFAHVAAFAALSLAACSSPTDENGEDEGAAKIAAAPVYLVQASLSTNPVELYDKLTVSSIASRGVKVTGPDLFGIVCTNEGDNATCTLNWLQRHEDAASSFILTGAVAKSIALALPERDRTYESGKVRFRCDVQKGGVLSADLYNCAFSGLDPVVRRIAGSVRITERSSLSEDEARSAAETLFPRM